MFRKPWNLNKDNALDLIMKEWNDEVVDAVQEELNIQDEQQVLLEEEPIHEDG
jgi:hypothetical protein